MPIIGATDIQPMNVLEQYAKGLEVGAAERALERQEVDRIKAAEQNRALNEMYARAMKPGGQVDVNALYGMLASGGMGTAIPGLQKAFGEAAEATAKGQAARIKAVSDKFQLARQQLPIANPARLEQWVRGVYADPDLAPIMQQYGTLDEVLAELPADAAGRAKWMQAASMIPEEYMKRYTTSAADELTAATQRRGQDITAATTRRGQDIQQATQERAQNIGVLFPKPATTGAAAAVDAGRGEVNTQVATLRDYYRQLAGLGGITDVTKTPIENIQAWASASPAGQAVGRALATDAQSIRNKIKQQRPLLLQAIKRATGMTAKQMDSNVELQLYLSAATDPTLDIQANLAALNNIDKLYGLGEGMAASRPGAPPSGASPSIDDLLNKYNK